MQLMRPDWSFHEILMELLWKVDEVFMPYSRLCLYYPCLFGVTLLRRRNQGYNEGNRRDDSLIDDCNGKERLVT